MSEMAQTGRGKKKRRLDLDEAELTIINNALNQSLELPASEFRTVIGAPKKAAEALLGRVAEALRGKGG